MTGVHIQILQAAALFDMEEIGQPSFNDRILRDNEATLSVARYIFENPVRAGLVKNPEDYPFLGSAKYSTREIMEAIRWQP